MKRSSKPPKYGSKELLVQAKLELLTLEELKMKSGGISFSILLMVV